jgi:hypothetical protein
MKRLLITIVLFAAPLALGGCADDGGYSTGYYDRYYGSGYYSHSAYYGPEYSGTYYRHYYNGYNWPY